MRNIFTVIVFVLSIGANAQDTVKYTLKECVDIAFANNLRIKRSVYNLETFEANLLQAKAAFLPTVNLGGSSADNYGRALNPVSNLYVDRNSSTLNANGQAILTLFNGLRLQNTLKQNNRDVAAANEDLSKSRNDIALVVITNYTNVIFKLLQSPG